MEVWLILLGVMTLVNATVKGSAFTENIKGENSAAETFIPDHKKAFDWLKRFNYVSGTADLITSGEIEESIKEPLSIMKKIYNLGNNGELDEKTQNFMLRPRCGNPDKPRELLRWAEGGHLRRKRWAVIPGVDTWVTPGNDFTFPITIGFNNYSSQMSKADQDAGLLFCATRWAQESGVSFEIFPEKKVANIFIGFSDALTNRGDVLAEADSPTPFLKPGSSHIIFDKRFKWVAKFAPGQPEEYVSFQETLCHEIGHSLGLDHSQLPEALMFASTQHRDFERDLNLDDIAGIRSIYGPPNNLVVVNRTPATPLPMPPSITAAPTPIGPSFTFSAEIQFFTTTTLPVIFAAFPVTSSFLPRRIKERRRHRQLQRIKKKRTRKRKSLQERKRKQDKKRKQDRKPKRWRKHTQNRKRKQKVKRNQERKHGGKKIGCRLRSCNS